MGCELTFVIFVLYFIVEEAREITFFGKRYFTLLWNWVDLIIIIVRYKYMYGGLEPDLGLPSGERGE